MKRAAGPRLRGAMVRGWRGRVVGRGIFVRLIR
jgi:hypothetical protein